MMRATDITFIFALARRPDGYLAQLDDAIIELRHAGLITTKYIGDGFVIARTVPAVMPARRAPSGRWTRRHPEGAFPREAKRMVRA
jgi:hypothetical protein